MGFMNPALLLLGMAAAVPILLHLLQRHQGPQVIFPALRYLRRAERESARKVRLRQLLLMLLRVAALLLLALAAARPYTRMAGAAHLPSAVVIVLDNSLSSGAVIGDVRVIDELRERALEVLAAANPDDRFWLIRAGSPWEPALAGDAAATAERVRETEPVAAGSDLAAAVTHARTVLAGGAEGRAREIHVLSDLQRSSLEGSAGAAGDEAVLIWAPGRTPPANAAVAAVEVGGGLAPVAGERATVVAGIVGRGVDTVAVRLVVDGRTIAAARAAPGDAAVLTLPARPAGPLTGHVEIDADALRADDRRYFAMRVAPRPVVATAGALPFVDNALAVMESAGRLRVASPAAATVVIQDGGAAAVSPPTLAVLFVAPTDPLQLPAANQRLATLGIPWRFDALSPGGEGRLSPSDDPLLRPLAAARIVTQYRIRREGESAADSVVLTLDDGRPWAVTGTRPNGARYVLLASPLDEESTTVPTSPALVPLLDRVIGGWLAPMASAVVAEPGSELALAAPADSVQLPDGSTLPLAQTRTFRVGGQAGVYQFFAADTLLHLAAVNPPAGESDLLPADRRIVRDVLGGNVRFADSPRDWTRQMYHARLGSELWRPLLLVALLLLLAEALVAAGARRRASGPVQVPT